MPQFDNESCAIFVFDTKHVEFLSVLDHDIQKLNNIDLYINPIGLYEGSIVSCKVVEDLPILDMVYVTANTQKDWEMLVRICITALINLN